MMKKIVNRPLRALAKVATLAVLTVGLSGCILRLTGGFVFTDDLGTFIDFIFDDVSVAYCDEIVDFETETETNECIYSIQSEDGSTFRTSTAELISDFGVFGLLVDPLIVQVPDSASVGAATVDDGSGPQNLRVTETRSFNVTPGVQSTAEAGHKFWIVELPLAIEAALPTRPNSVDLDFKFEYNGPPETDGNVTFKALSTGRVEANGETYYLPLYPCTADFAQVPEINLPAFPGFNLPLNGFIFALLDIFGDFGINGDLGCDNQVYDLTPVEPPPQALLCDTDEDSDVDRNDILEIVASRNSAALTTFDPRDSNGDGRITLLDVRSCMLSCTLPGCAIR